MVWWTELALTEAMPVTDLRPKAHCGSLARDMNESFEEPRCHNNASEGLPKARDVPGGRGMRAEGHENQAFPWRNRLGHLFLSHTATGHLHPCLLHAVVERGRLPPDSNLSCSFVPRTVSS